MNQTLHSSPLGVPVPRRIISYGAVWLILIAIGSLGVASVSMVPGKNANAPTMWPIRSTLERSHDTSTLVMLLHPKCSCSSASLDQLARILTKARTSVKSILLFSVPDKLAEDWDQNSLLNMASEIKGAQVVRDINGQETARFGSFTSGEVLLYDRNGRLTFEGGITASRGERGPAESAHSLETLINFPSPQTKRFSVFGCELVKSW